MKAAAETVKWSETSLHKRDEPKALMTQEQHAKQCNVKYLF
jgi:hypothetical protein